MSGVRLSGAFVQLDADSLTADWPTMLGAMQQLGMDQVIVQYVRDDQQDYSPAVMRLLEAAATLGMRVWVGLPLLRAQDWFAWSFWPPFLTRFGTPCTEAARGLAACLAAQPACCGIYVPYETNGLAWPWAIGAFYARLVQAVHAVRPDWPVMIAPYTNLIPGIPLSLPRLLLGWWWGVVLRRAAVDVLAWQDGVGSCAGQLARVSHNLGALKRVCERHGVRLWANLEAFERTSPLSAPFAATAAPPPRFEAQIAASAPLAECLVAFDFNHYLDPTVGAAQEALYAALDSGSSLA